MLILTPADFSTAPAHSPASALHWASSADGQFVLDHGRCPANLLPANEDVVLMLPPSAVSWHWVSLPKVAQSKVRAVLDGLLEERVLSETGELHYALEPGARPGQTVWVAACNKAWLQSWLQMLEAAGRPVSRIVPAMWPQRAVAAGTAQTGTTPTLVHWAHRRGEQVCLASAGPKGVSTLLLQESKHGSASALSPQMLHSLLLAEAGATESPTAQWLADPAAAALAERAIDQRFELVSPSSWMLRCAQSDWNLAQFDLSLSAGARRGERLKRLLWRFRTAPAWRPTRWGLVGLAVVQLVGLNTAAWSERQSLAAKQQAAHALAQQTFPQISLVLDAPLQMRRELAQLQSASGQLSGHDLETMLAALGQAAPEHAPASIHYSRGQGRFGQWTGASAEQMSALPQRLNHLGWRARFDGTDLTLEPAER